MFYTWSLGLWFSDHSLILKFGKPFLVSIETDVNLAWWVDVVGITSNSVCHIESNQVACNKLASWVTSEIARIKSACEPAPATLAGTSHRFWPLSGTQSHPPLLFASLFCRLTVAIMQNVFVMALQRQISRSAGYNGEQICRVTLESRSVCACIRLH